MTIDRLPPIKKQKGQPMRFVRLLESQIIKPKKPGFPVVDAKKAAKILEGLGKTVTGIHGHGDGSFTITASTVETTTKHLGNEWDEVLSHG